MGMAVLLMSIRLGRVAIAVAVAALVLFLATGVYVSAQHRWQVWRNDGVYCIPVNEADGNDFLYGDDCP